VGRHIGPPWQRCARSHSPWSAGKRAELGEGDGAGGRSSWLAVGRRWMASRWPASHGGGGRRVLPAAREDGDQGRCDGGMLHMGVGLAVEKRLVCTLNDWVPHVTFLGQLGGDTQKPPPTPRTLAPVAASGGGGPRWAKNDAARSPYSTSLSPSLPLLSPNHTRRCPSHLRRERKSGPPIARVTPPDVGSVFWELGSESFESPLCLEAGARQ
jgi:hypothetical protein